MTALNRGGHSNGVKLRRIEKENAIMFTNEMSQDTNVVRTFYNETFDENIRVVDIDGEGWFVGKDVAEALGYKLARKALFDHVDDKDKLAFQIGTSGQRREMTLINENGLFDLVVSSKLPNAIEFRRWITHVVIPSIYHYDIYTTDEMYQNYLNDKDIFDTKIREAEAIKESYRQKYEQQQKQIEEMMPKVNAYERLHYSYCNSNVTNIGKNYGLSAGEVNYLLTANGIQYYDVSVQHYVLTPEYQNQGLEEFKDCYDADGIKHTFMCWTIKGVEFVQDFLESQGFTNFTKPRSSFFDK